MVGTPQQMNDMRDTHVYEGDRIDRSFLPDCWTDTKRMTSLMAPFRAREANPEGWDLKMNFWTNCITKWSLSSHSVVFTAKDVIKAFERGDKRPDIQCIKLVISYMKRNKSLVSLTEFKLITDRNSNKNWINWGLNIFVFKPFSVLWSLVSSSRNSEEILPEVSIESKFVAMQTLQQISEDLNKYIYQLEDNVCIKFDYLFHKCKNRLDISLETFEAVVNHLEFENKLKVFLDNGVKIVKIGKNADIKESDHCLISLETAKEMLKNDIEKHETQIEAIKEEAKVYDKNKNSEICATLLMRKKERVENKLRQKVTQLEKVELLIDHLISTKSDK